MLVAIVVLALACAGILLTIFLFVGGWLYSRSTVDRMLSVRDEELSRLRQDAAYYRTAAQSCAVANAHLEGQLRVAQELLSDRDGDSR